MWKTCVLTMLFCLASFTNVVSSVPEKRSYGQPQWSEEQALTMALADGYEQDDSCDQATEISMAPFYQYHTFHDEGDADWVKFSAEVGRTYVIRAQDIGISADPWLELYSSCSKLLLHSSNQTLGSATIQFVPPATGNYYVKVRNSNTSAVGEDTAYSLSVSVQPWTAGAEGAVVIVAVDSVHLQANIDYATNTAYRTFYGLGFSDDDIYYINPGYQDVDGDGSDDVDAVPTNANLHTALTSWASPRLSSDAPLYLYVMGAGMVDQIPLSTEEYVTAAELDLWLTDLESQTGLHDVNVIFDGCHTGSFIDGSAEISGPGRVIIASTSRDQLAYASSLGAYFSDAFWGAIQEGANLADAFDVAVWAVAAAGVPQTPWLDDNGNATPNETADGTLALKRTPSPKLSPDRIITLILVNESQIRSLHGTTGQLMENLHDLRLEDRVRGVVIPLEEYPSVAGAYQAWEAHLTDTTYANAVTDAIRQVILDELQTYPNVEYLVLVGEDQALPFRRVVDGTFLSESNYSRVSITTTVGAALADDMTLTDNFYADLTFSTWDGHDLYIPDLAVGRLVETPAEISGQIDYFLMYGGRTVEQALVTGRDFMVDGAQEICATLDSKGITSNCDLIGDSWTMDDFRPYFLRSTNDLVALNQSANHYTYFASPVESLTSREVLSDSADLEGVIIYHIADHAGLNVPPENSHESLDWPQALAQKRAVYIASTGYAWVVRDAVGLGEAFVLSLTQHLVSGAHSHVGQALVRAKQSYYAEQSTSFSAYDEKILLEYTLYGLPMYRVRSSSTSLPTPTLFSISNADEDSNYTVAWSSVSGATTYVLEEDATPNFTSPTTRYMGAVFSYAITDQPEGTWHYRVKALSTTESSTWSNIESVTVHPNVDGFEPDDHCSQATILSTDATVQTHTFHDPGDEDWVTFSATAGTSYIIQGSGVGPLVDLVPELHNACEQPVLPTDDVDFGQGFRLIWECPATGQYYLKVRNHDDGVYGEGAYYNLSIRQQLPGGVAVIVAGHRDVPEGLMSNFTYSANMAYRIFRRGGYSPEQIYYLHPDVLTDADGDGIADVDAPSSSDNLQWAMTNWAAERVGPETPFYLYMIDHGADDLFYIDTWTDAVSAASLDNWLTELEREGCPINVILESCESGSFILPPHSISGPNRVIISAAQAGQIAYGPASGRGAYFSNTFLPQFAGGADLWSAYTASREALWNRRLLLNYQQPWLDDNGDGVSDRLDGEVARQRGLLAAFGSAVPWIATVSPAKQIESTSAVITATIYDDGAIEEVWAEIYPPSYHPPESPNPITTIDVPRIRLVQIGSQTYSGTYEEFNEMGEYQIIVYAQDEDSYQATPRVTTVRTGYEIYLPMLLRED